MNVCKSIAPVLLAGSTLVAGCTWTGSVFSDKVDYQAARTRTTPLEVPPDLSQLPRDERYAVPEVAAVRHSIVHGSRAARSAGHRGRSAPPLHSRARRGNRAASNGRAISAGWPSACRQERRGRSCSNSGRASDSRS